MRRVEFFLAFITLVGVLSIGILPGILVAVALALLVVIRRISRPHDAVLGSVEGSRRLPGHRGAYQQRDGAGADRLPL